LRPGTAAADARLLIEEIPATCWCDSCRQEFTWPELGWDCPRCGSPSRELRRGRELELASLEVS
jgi:hydrogenase nickel incorporation protein HypA/HybF